MTALLPAQALVSLLPAEAGAQCLLVARPGSDVVHVAVPALPLTPAGRLRRGERPVCGRTARAWRRTSIDGRRGRRCGTAGVRGRRCAAPRPLQLLAETLTTARDLPTVETAAALVITTPGAIFSLAPKVRAARERLIATGAAPAPRRHRLQPGRSMRRAG